MKHGSILAALLVLGAALAAPAGAADYPAGPVTLLLGFAPGGLTDAMARLLAPRLGDALGQAVIVENRPGAGTLIATRAGAQAVPDGQIILMTSSTIVLNSLAYKAPGYKMSDFATIAPVISTPFILSVASGVPARSIGELVNYAKSNPGTLNSASLGASSVTTLALDRFADAAGFDAVKVNYGGSGPALQAIEGGVVQLFMDGAGTTLAAAKSPTIRMLAITSDQRSPLAPDLPTFKEQGFPTMGVLSWTATFVPIKTPGVIVQKARAAFVKVLAEPDIQQRLIGMGFDMWVGKPEDFPAYIDREVQLWGKDIRRAGLQLDY